MLSPEDFNKRGAENLPGYLGVVVIGVSAAELRAELAVKKALMAPNGFLGYGCVANLPEGATGFTTIELKSNHLGTARDGVIECVAKPLHFGRTTQVWDATVTHRESGKTLALFRCTQLLLYK
jgi:1,4-dihydroxy-2-naphthoyl-CoA hydrolase